MLTHRFSPHLSPLPPPGYSFLLEDQRPGIFSSRAPNPLRILRAPASRDLDRDSSCRAGRQERPPQTSGSQGGTMAVYLNDDLEDLQDDRFDSDGFGVSGSRDGHPSSPNKHKNDTSAVEYRNGKDMQGIPWERLKYSRDQYRKMRLKHYKNYENLARSHQGFDMECKQVETNDKFYDFCFNTRLVKPTIVHFQLRNLVWATSKHDVYMAQNNSVMHWSSLLQRGTEVLHVAGQVVPKQKTHGARTLSRVQISTMALKDNLMVAGGFRGELIFKYVDKPGVAFCTNAADNKNSVTNAVDVYESPSGATRVTAANNDCTVKFLDAERCSLLSRFTFPWSVNNTSVSPDGKLLAVLGDSSDCVITDAQSGEEIATLKGHLDYSFSSAWHPGGHVLATGNQDKTCRLWDTRNLSAPFAVLGGRIGAVRGLRFSSDGRFLAAAEAADFVHVYDARAGYGAAQEIGLFGEIAGVAFSPDADALFVGVADRAYGSLLEFGRRGRHAYLDSYL
uniref:WD repeat-containing protein C2A9.03 n=6 Tax=Aegilops tauschii subsp. strangulata TaxID=200361 RepID=A0A453B1P2_AEGTS